MPRVAVYGSGDVYGDPNLVYGPASSGGGTNMSTNSNRISKDLSGAPITAINGAVDVLDTELAFQISLTPDEKAKMAKAAEKRAGFIEKTRSFIVSHPQFMPGFVNMTEFNMDVALHDHYMSFLLRLRTHVAKGNDTLMVIDSEIYRACLAYYESVERAANMGSPGAQPIYDELSEEFPGRGPASNPPPTP